MTTRSTLFVRTFWINSEYSIGLVCGWRLPKLLNTDINTTAMTSHSSRFFVRLFNADLDQIPIHPTVASHSATPAAQLQPLPVLGPINATLSALKALRQQINLATLGTGRTRFAGRNFVELPAQTPD